MVTELSESSSFPSHEIPSLADLTARFEALPNETVSRKARVRTAVATLSRAIGKPPSDISALPKAVKPLFAQLRRLPTGLSAKSIANCKSELRYLMNKVGGHDRKSGLMPLSQDWLELRTALGDQPELWKLCRFFAHCSSQGISPREVTDQAIATFEAGLGELADVANPKWHVRDTIRTWNKLSETGVAGFDLPLLTLPPIRTNRWTIEPSAFPASFQDEVSAWLARLATVDPDDEEGPVRALRPATLDGLRHVVFKAGSALVFAGRAIETVTSLSCIVEMDAFKTILRYLRERRGGQRTPALYAMAINLKAMAEHEVKVKPDHLLRMAKVCSNYYVEGHVTKSRERLENFEDESLLGPLLHLPERLLKEAANPKVSRRSARTLAQMAVALEIELHAPLRLSNLAALNLKENIRAIVVDGETRWVIRFDRDETKNHSRVTYELPAAAVKRIERGLAYYEQTAGWLFPGRKKGTHKTAPCLGDQLKQEVERRIPVPFNIHLMRGIAATMQVREHDNGFEMARAILGDRSDQVVRKHYTATADQKLIRKAQDTLQNVRVRTAPIVPTRTKHITAN